MADSSPRSLPAWRRWANRSTAARSRYAGSVSNDRPIAGTWLVREYQGIEYCVTVRDDGYEYQGRPYRSLSAIARVITVTQWNGWVFFGVRRSGAGR